MLDRALIIILTYVTVLNGLRIPFSGSDIRLEQIVLSACAILFLLASFLRKQTIQSIRLWKHDLLLVLFWGIMIASSLLFAPHKKYSLIQSTSQIIISFSYFIIAKFVSTEKNIKTYLNHCFNATIIIAIIGVCFFFISLVTGYALYGINLTQNESDAFGIFLTMREPNLWGCYMMGVFFLALSVSAKAGASLFEISSVKIRIVLLCTIVSIILSFTRGVWLATIVGLVMYYFQSGKGLVKNLPKLIYLSLFIGFSFFFLRYFLQIDIISYKLNNFLSTDVGTGQGRLIIWGLALDNWVQSGHWILGNGMYSFASFFNTDNYGSETNSWIGNLYITLLHDVGILGFFVLAWFFKCVLKKNNRVKAELRKDSEAKVLRGVHIAIISTLLSFFFTTGLSLSFCWILFGLAIGLRRFLSPNSVLSPAG
jgi:hypothetical protein